MWRAWPRRAGLACILRPVISSGGLSTSSTSARKTPGFMTAAPPAAERRWPRRCPIRTSPMARGSRAPIRSTSAPTRWWNAYRRSKRYSGLVPAHGDRRDRTDHAGTAPHVDVRNGSGRQSPQWPGWVTYAERGLSAGSWVVRLHRPRTPVRLPWGTSRLGWTAALLESTRFDALAP